MVTQSLTAPETPKPLPLLALAALGIVFGDLGTSPLYALQEAFNGNHGVAATPANVLGIISLFLWALILMVSIKYVLVLMRADHRGEGGILALLALLAPPRQGGRARRNWVLVGLVGAAMLFGDGVITPAISVLSAVEGLSVATPTFEPWIVPLTVAILVGLFAVQPYGSGKVGVVFGPILVSWFVVIALLGAWAIAENPAVLAALDPRHALAFFAHNRGHGFVALGAVVLCLTGGEALYADMGHFGRRPIRLAWYGLALPALTLNYLGQGALLLTHPEAASRPFYSLVPGWLLYPMVALATLSTVVASQALISAVFSLTRQAAQMGLFPRVRVVHTSGAQIGQIYLPTANWLLMVATIAVVLAFGSSDRLAAAFGLAVSATMTITTLLFAVLAYRQWRWPLVLVGLVAGTFLCADLAFFAANTLKFLDGGWLPLSIATLLFAVMATWFLGEQQLSHKRDAYSVPLDDFLTSLATAPYRIGGSGVFLTEHPDRVPTVLLHHLKHNQVLHQRVVLLTLEQADCARIAPTERLRINTAVPLGFMSVVARYGYQEQPDVPALLDAAARAAGMAPFEPLATSYYLGHHSLVAPAGLSRLRRAWLGFFALLRNNAQPATRYFGLPANQVVELGARIEL